MLLYLMIGILWLLSQGEESNEAEARPKVRLVVPNSSCGGIIGKGGSTIKYVPLINLFLVSEILFLFLFPLRFFIFLVGYNVCIP